MGTKLRRSDKWGVRQIGETQWVFRDPAQPQRRVFIRDASREVHAEWKRNTMWGRYSSDPAARIDAMRAEPRGKTFEVWLNVKRNPKKERITGDLLDALALASQIINRPPQVQR